MKGCLTIVVALGIIGIFMAIFGSHQETPVMPAPTPVAAIRPVKPTPASSPVGSATVAAISPSPTPEAFPKEGSWPDKVHLMAPVQLSGAVGSGSITMTSPVGTEVFAFLSDDHKTVTVEVNQLKGTVPIESTDFLILAKAKERLKNEAAINEQKRAVEAVKMQEQATAASDAEYGEKPEFYDAGFSKKIPPLVEATLKSGMSDPDSFKIRDIGGMAKTEYKGQKCYEIQFTYSGKNGFIATRVGTITAWVKNGIPLDIKSNER